MALIAAAGSRLLQRRKAQALRLTLALGAGVRPRGDVHRSDHRRQGHQPADAGQAADALPRSSNASTSPAAPRPRYAAKATPASAIGRCSRPPARPIRPGSSSGSRGSRSAFNGTVVVEWLNVSAGSDTDPGLGYAAAELDREGYAYVGVSAQQAGINGSTPRRHRQPAAARGPRLGPAQGRPGALRLAASPRRRVLLRHVHAGRAGVAGAGHGSTCWTGWRRSGSSRSGSHSPRPG